MDEQKAITRLKQGDIKGLEFLIDKYQAQAVGIATLITRDRALAEDVVQAAFIHAYEHIDQFQAGCPFGPWFLKSVSNAAVRQATRQQRHVSLDYQLDETEDECFDWLTDPSPKPEELIEQIETRQEILIALSKLSPEQRAVIIQRYYLDMSEREMAITTRVPPSTIKGRLYAARERLRLLLHSLRPTQQKARDKE